MAKVRANETRADSCAAERVQCKGEKHGSEVEDDGADVGQVEEGKNQAGEEKLDGYRAG